MLASGQSYLMAFNITAATTANTPIHIDATVAIKSPVSTYPSAVIRLVAGFLQTDDEAVEPIAGPFAIWSSPTICIS